jgi:cytochrome P450
MSNIDAMTSDYSQAAPEPDFDPAGLGNGDFKLETPDLDLESVCILTRYKEVRAAAYDPGAFSSREMLLTRGRPSISFAAPPISSDPPDHRWPRTILASVFSRSTIDRLTPRIEELAAGLIEGLAGKSVLDGAADYAAPLAARAFSVFLGTPDEDAERLQGWARDVSGGSQKNVEVYVQAMVEIGRYLDRAIELGPRPGGALDGLLSYRKDGRRLVRPRVIDMARLLVIAGSDTTAAVLGGAIHHLATHPDDRKTLVADISLMPVAIEEFLRLYTPVSPARVLRKDVEIGQRIQKAGDRVVLSFAAANRDPEAFANPDQVDFERIKNHHMAFGAGIHRCIGAYFAQAQLRIGLGLWLRAYPDYRSRSEPIWSAGAIRGLLSLPLEAAAAAP